MLRYGAIVKASLFIIHRPHFQLQRNIHKKSKAEICYGKNENVTNAYNVQLIL